MPLLSPPSRPVVHVFSCAAWAEQAVGLLRKKAAKSGGRLWLQDLLNTMLPEYLGMLCNDTRMQLQGVVTAAHCHGIGKKAAEVTKGIWALAMQRPDSRGALP